MSRGFELLDERSTAYGDLTLRRRRLPGLDHSVLEVKLGEAFLMSSLFTEGEIALAELGLADLDRAGLDVAIGGLGLGYTAQAALEHAHLRSLLVIDALGEVIDWHREGIVPLGPVLVSDPRCRLLQGDFFALVEGEGLDPEAPGRRFDAILVDIDHSPSELLDPAHAHFYEPAGLERLARHLQPGGVFALWSQDPPEDAFLAKLERVFSGCEARIVEFDNPLQGRRATNTIYRGMRRGSTGADRAREEQQV